MNKDDLPAAPLMTEPVGGLNTGLEILIVSFLVAIGIVIFVGVGFLFSVPFQDPVQCYKITPSE